MREALLRVEHTDIGEGEHLVPFRDGLAAEQDASPSAPDDQLLTELREDFTRWQAEVAPAG